jgi:type IV secretion system protein VirB9
MRSILLVALASTALSACSGKTPPPAITYDETAFKPATELHDPAPPAPGPNVAAGAVFGPAVPATPSSKHDSVSPTVRVEAANRAALHEPSASGYINAVQIYPFSDNALYRLYAAPQQVSDIALQPGETLIAISAGDTVRWTVGDTTSGNGPQRQVHVLVKPFQPDLKTNLVILTDKRTYHLELQSTTHATMAAVSWSYPGDGLVTDQNDAAQRAAAAAPFDSGIALDALNFRYRITGDDPPWKPLRAFDDTHKVYIEFPKRIDQGEMPPLFVIGPDGGTELVNYRVRGNYYIVDRLFGAAELRMGQDPQQVVRISRAVGRRANHGLGAIFGG